MAPGAGGGVDVGVKANVVATLEPQPFTATPVIKPAVLPAVTVIVAVP